MRFTIFTHVEHIAKGEKYFAYPPYVREMNIWVNMFEEVEVVAPTVTPEFRDFKGEPIYEEAYKHSKLIFTSIPTFDILSITSIFITLYKIPWIFFRIFNSMQRADHMHLRCPGNIGLLACICQIFFPHKQKTAKYAGNWDPEAKQPWSYKLQKWILSNTFLTRNMTILVYGQWPAQTKNILPFFTASFYENEIVKIDKDFSEPLKFLFVGNLVPGKQPLFAMQLVEVLREKNISVELHIYGDGPLNEVFESEAENKDYIHIHGNQSLEILKQAYKESHFLILASKSEGWPKAVAEAMFFGCIPVGTAVSCVPWMLNYGKRGVIIYTKESRKESKEKRLIEKSGEKRLDSQDVLNETAGKILQLIKDPKEIKRISVAAQRWSQQFTLDRFEKEIKTLLDPQPFKGE